jgi:hypothetical protein
MYRGDPSIHRKSPAAIHGQRDKYTDKQQMVFVVGLFPVSNVQAHHPNTDKAKAKLVRIFSASGRVFDTTRMPLR